MPTTAAAARSPELAGTPLGPARAGLLAAAFALLALLVYAPSLRAPFYSDDLHYVVYNEYLHDLDALKLRDVLSPWGGAAMMTQNYAPIHLLGHAAGWWLFGPQPTGHHVVNVLLHALASTLLVLLFLQCGAGTLAAIGGGAAFLLHPANVEAVAWISQLKTTLALVLALAALLLRRRHPALAWVCFSLALLAKALAAFALPVALGLELLRSPGPGEAGTRCAEPRRVFGWLAAWAAVFVLLTALEFPLFHLTNANAPPLHPELAGRLRGIAVIGARYLVMAASSLGVSAFHEASAGGSWLEPGPLAALLLLAGLSARALHVARRRRVEAAFWGWAAISFLPVSQVFPFLYPMGDRYLYFILPGLIGGVLFAGRDLLARSPETSRRTHARVALALSLVWLVAIGAHALQRTRLWRDPARVDAEARRRYPDGLLAAVHDAGEAAARGDAERATQLLRRSIERGNYHFWSLQREAQWDPVREDPRFRAVLEEMARWWVELEPRYRRKSQLDLRGFADAYLILGDLDAAIERLEQALEVGGLRDDEIRRRLIRLRIQRAERDRGVDR